MMRLIYAMALVTMIAGIGCDKDDDNPAAPAVTYMPNTANSTWSYSIESYGPTTITSSYTLKATSKDTTINNKTYRVFTNSSGANDYYAQVGTDYYQLGSIAALGSQRAELLFLKDANVGSTWSETQMVTISGIPSPVSVPVNYQIVKKGYDTAINGKTFTDVTHVKITFGTISVSGFPIVPVTDLNFHYARGIGRISSRTKILVTLPPPLQSINLDDKLTLTSYTIQ